jgi:GTP-binding protein EngB required for normal cell division
LQLYRLFNDLQGIAKDLNIIFDYPEIVVVGMQSDGKSSFIEGLLGFQFNIVESNIGTRRPLIIQMLNNPSKEQPSCRFRKEYPSPEGDPFEDHETLIHELVDEIIKRTNDRAGIGNDKVSDIPIILRVEYCYCANLTIYDTPGFRLGGDEKLKNDITKMVMKLIEPKNRIIVCLEQSTVEWANTVSRPIVRKVDPEFQRTILINTKFDNRCKELRTKQAADTYLNGENLPLNTKPFFVSMPVRRNLDSTRFKDAIRESIVDDYEKLLEVNFDEKRFLPQLGLFKVKSYLEKLLNERYQQSLAPTLRSLEDLCKKTEIEKDQIKNQLQQHDIEQLKNAANCYIQSFVNQIDNLLGGSIAGEPDKTGENLEEEKLNSGLAEWPDFNADFDIQNSKLRVYGGAQYSRLLNEFEYVAHSREFPFTTASEIASAIGASKAGYTVPVFETAAANLVQMKAKYVFIPLIDIVLARCSYIMKRLFSIAVHVIKHDRDHRGIGILSVYEKFMNELRNTFDQFIDKIEQDCRSRLKDDFIMFTKIVDWELLTTGTSDSTR